MDIPVSEIAEQATTRLIPAAAHKPPVLRPLVDSDDEMAVLAGIEGLTNRRLRAERAGLAQLDARELAYGIWGASHVNAAFAYTRTGGNRFNGEERGAWYAAFEDLTAIAEVGYHKTRELAAVGVYYDETVYQALLAGFIGEFHDLRSVAPAPACLGEDPFAAYPEGQRVAEALRREGARGLVYPSVRKPGGTCIVAFVPHAVQSVRLGPRWKLIWGGSPEFTVTQG